MAQPHKPLRFGLIGCGRVSGHHLRAVRSLGERARLLAVCDPDAEAARAAAEATGATAFADASAMLAEADLDVVAIATPSGLHAAQAMAAARAGCHVICEKPLATRWADATAMVAACRRAGVRLFPVLQLRYSPSVVAARRAVADGRLGQVALVDVDVVWTRPQAYYDSAGWRGTRQMDGGVLLNQASHYVDLMVWLGGPVEAVGAMVATCGRDIEVEDTATMQLRYAAGGVGSLSATVLSVPQNIEGSVTICGTRGTIRLGGLAAERIDHWAIAGEATDPDWLAEVNAATAAFYGDGHLRCYANVADVLGGRAPADADADEGLVALELVEAAYRASASGVRVGLPLERPGRTESPDGGADAGPSGIPGTGCGPAGTR